MSHPTQPATSHDALLEIRCDLYICTQFLFHLEEVPEPDRIKVAYSMKRILQRLEELHAHIEELILNQPFAEA